MSLIDFLKKAQVFSILNKDQLETIEHYSKEKTYSKDDIVFAEGEDANYVWIVKEGEVDLRFDLPGGRQTNRRNTISKRMEKMIFGWSFLVPPYKYRLSAYCAAETCNLISVDKDCLLKIFNEDSTAGYRFMSKLIEVVGDRFQKLQESSASFFVRKTE